MDRVRTHRPRPRRFPRAAWITTVAGVLSAGAVSPAAAQDAGSQHGEASAEEQRDALQGLNLPEEGVTPPAGVDSVLWRALLPADAMPDAGIVALGRELYFDTRLSSDGSVSCSTCHDVTRGFTDQRMVSEGIGGQLGRRNAPTTLNAALIEPQFWDGRARAVEDQALLPILNSIEMGEQSEAQVVERLEAVPEYVAAFREIFGGEIRYADVGRAIGAFERTLIFLDAPFDRWQQGDDGAVSEDVRKGHELFNGKARCATCHPISLASPLGTNLRFHNIGVSARDQDFERLAREALALLEEDSSEEALDELALNTDLSQLGRFVVTRDYAHVGAFRTPQLRNVGITAPYMHDGSLQTLWDVMDHYNKGGEANPFLDGGMEALALSEEEIGQLVAFLFAMTDVRFTEQNEAARARQAERARTTRPFRDEALAQRRQLTFEQRVLGTER